MDYLKLKGKCALVTGGARGIGAAVAAKLTAFGARVVICDVRDEEGAATATAIGAKGEVYYRHCDVANENEVTHCVAEAEALLGRLDILVNNAGIGAIPKAFETLAADEWDRMLRTDLTSAFFFCRAAVPGMKARRYGKIINISSGSGVIGCEFCAHYATAKAGMIGFTQSIAKELAGHKINVNVIAAPTTDTQQLVDTAFDAFVPAAIEEIPWGRIATPEDLADMVLYLASDASEYVTGQVLAPNGGRRTPI